MTSTAGSANLSLTKGAMARTAMPQAPTNTRQSACENCLRVQSARERSVFGRQLLPAKRELSTPSQQN